MRKEDGDNLPSGSPTSLSIHLNQYANDTNLYTQARPLSYIPQSLIIFNRHLKLSKPQKLPLILPKPVLPPVSPISVDDNCLSLVSLPTFCTTSSLSGTPVGSSFRIHPESNPPLFPYGLLTPSYHHLLPGLQPQCPSWCPCYLPCPPALYSQWRGQSDT